MTIKHFFFVLVFVLSCMMLNALGEETSTFRYSVVENQKNATQILQLQKGWNLCALTIAPDADSIALLNNHGVYWGWKNGHFKLLESFQPWQGFWTYSDENVQLTLTGEEAVSTPLHPGWNLVGIDAGIKEKLSRDGLHAWCFDQKSYLQVGDTFLPGLGYWIFIPSVIKPRISYILVPTDGMWRIDGGDWNDSGVTVTTEIGVHTISFLPIDGYTTPADETVTLAEGEKLSQNVEYAIIPPTVTVILNPASGKWRLDNGDWNDSSATVETTVGEHTVSFDSVDGYTTPANETITLIAGEKFSKTIDYEAIPPTVTVTLNPATGKWRLDDGDWNNSGATVTTTVGEHTVSFDEVDGYTTPAAQIIALSAGERLSQIVDYEEVPPSVTYTLNPTSGKWRMDNGEWYDSGTTITTTVGSHRISFKAVDGYTTPAAQNIILTMGQNLSRTVNYVAKQPTVTYTISPTSGKWRLDNGEWNKSGATVTTTAGEHTVSFDAIDGYTTPIAQNITLQMGENLSQNVTYEVILPTVTYMLDPPNGKWRIDDGDWNDSGITVTTTVGSHTISFMEIDGYTVPANQNLMMGAGRNTTRTASYTVIQPTVCYTLDPTSAKWRIDNGSWNDSGATVTTTVGNHTVHFMAVDGYMTPNSQNFILSAGENFVKTINYELGFPVITYTLNPQNGRWRLDDGDWNYSGNKVTTTVGEHTISFQAIEGYFVPENQNIILALGDNLSKTVEYEAIPPTVTYTLNPPYGKWRLDDGAWNVSGATVTTTVGNHIVSFMKVLGYHTPSNQSITLIPGQTYHKDQDYDLHETLYIVVDLSSGPDSDNYPVRYTDTAPNLDDDTCRTTELWLRKIPAGSFIMGSPEDEVGRELGETQHQVILSQDYYIGVFECTQRQWELVMGTRPSYFNNDEYYMTRPVEQISYDMIRGTSSTAGAGWPAYGHAVDTSSFMGKLQARTGLVFDLPTEAQWEYSCRAGTTTALNSGKNITNPTNEDSAMNEVGRYGSNGGKGSSQTCSTDNGTSKVGSYVSNAWGLYDMHGNVFEWCLDWYGTYTTSNTLVENPVGVITGADRIRRGGFWRDYYPKYCRSAYRDSRKPSYDDFSVGFRIACVPDLQQGIYAVVDLSPGPDAEHYPVRYTDTPPDLNDDTCRTTELWLRKIYAGTFIMGAPLEEQDLNGGVAAEDQHKVVLTQDYFIGVFECTQKQWELVMGNKPSYFNNADYYTTRPVEKVSYDDIRGTGIQAGAGWPKYAYTVDASSFMGKLKAKTGGVFDLPTEAQWEYACRAGTKTALNSGKDFSWNSYEYNINIINEVGRWFSDRDVAYRHSTQDCSPNYGTAKVGSYLPNAWGLYDMHVNVAEWCLDWFNVSYYSYYIFDGITDPNGPNDGSERIIRGGCWHRTENYGSLRSASRYYGTSDYYTYDLGFRIVLLP